MFRGKYTEKAAESSEEEEKEEEDVRGGRAAAAETMCGPQSLNYLRDGLLQRSCVHVSPRV